MSRGGFNPTRRSRNIGTARQGHGQSNQHVIPTRGQNFRKWTEQLGPHREVSLAPAGRKIRVIVEETNAGCVHPCTPEDLGHMLRQIPLQDWQGLETFVLRQSTRKQRLLRPAWGRLLYHARLGQPGRPAKFVGPAIIFEAIEPEHRFKWSSSLDPDDLAELARLKADGHRVERLGPGFEVTTSITAARSTQLYRTLLHEIGHWVDWQEKVERPESMGGDFEALCASYFQRPVGEREAFAHRYAAETLARLERFGLVPFPPQISDALSPDAKTCAHPTGEDLS